MNRKHLDMASSSRSAPGHLPWVAWTRVASPLGQMLLAANAQGLAGCWFNGQAHHPGEPTGAQDDHHPLLLDAAAQLAAYWRRPSGFHFDLPLAPQGSDFQQAVWRELQGISPGSTRSYGELASRLGKASAARAVGAAVGRNPLSIVIPCHRVLGAQGQLTGYAGGLDRKIKLLQAEQAGANFNWEDA